MPSAVPTDEYVRRPFHPLDSSEQSNGQSCHAILWHQSDLQRRRALPLIRVKKRVRVCVCVSPPPSCLIFEVEIMHSVHLCKRWKMFYYVSEVYHFCYYQVMSPQFRYIYSINFEFTLSIVDVEHYLDLHTTIRFAE